MNWNSSQPILDVQDLSVSIQRDSTRLTLVDRVSLQVYEREIVGLVGESGSGKSVTALALARLIRGQSMSVEGRILLGGVDLLSLPEKAMRRVRGGKIGFIFQEPMTSLNPVQTIGRQIAESLRIHLKLSRNEIRDRVLSLLNQVAMPSPLSRMNEYPHQLSGGLRQRAMIAIALACEPDFIIADEPTTALDVTIQDQILSVMRRLADDHRCGILFITHDMGVVARMCDRVNVMYAGQIVESGTAENIFYTPKMPYTRALLDAIPGTRRLVDGDRLQTIGGSSLVPGGWPDGCRFAGRCCYQRELCSTNTVLLTDRGSGHLGRCIGTENGGWIA